jgi:hypothetical protein
VFDSIPLRESRPAFLPSIVFVAEFHSYSFASAPGRRGTTNHHQYAAQLRFFVIDSKSARSTYLALHYLHHLPQAATPLNTCRIQFQLATMHIFVHIHYPGKRAALGQQHTQINSAPCVLA